MVQTKFQSQDDNIRERKLAQNTKRMERLRDAKQRTIGLDIDALDAMVAEKEELKKAEKDANMAEAARMQQLQNILLEAESSIFEQQSMQNKNLAESWHQQISQNEQKKRQEIADRPKPIVPEETGKSGCQNFDGEDCAFEQRRRLQAQQFRQWAQAQISERENKIKLEKEEDMKTAHYLREVEESCKAMESDHLGEQQRLKMEMVMYNKMLAEEKRQREAAQKEAEQNANLAEIEGQLNDPYLVEDPSMGTSVKPGRFRKDHYKGLGPEAMREMCEENRRLAEEKTNRLKLQKDEDRAYAKNLQQISEQLNVQHFQQQEFKRDELLKQKATLNAQREELKAKNKVGLQEARGEIGASFFGNFGSSVR